MADTTRWSPYRRNREENARLETLLVGNTDAVVWAQEFCALYGGDEALMVSWFSGAINAGFDAGKEEFSE
jgi:hypothetical protein